MISAIYEKDTIFIQDFNTESLRKMSESKLLKCPDCGDVLVFRECQHKQSHFAHLKKDCTYPFREPESLEHETGKLATFEWLKTQFPKEECFVEKKVEITNQRSDTYVKTISTAVEFQCSPIHANTWKTRNQLYKQAKINDIWVLGYSMHKRYIPTNPYAHKLNSLELELLSQYGKIIYYDVLSKQFIFLYIEKETKSFYIGKEFYFKPDEVFIKDGTLNSKYDYFIQIQKKREEFLIKEIIKAEETDEFIKNLKSNVDAEKVLATKKQINFIKYLLQQQGKKIPYKLHGLLKEEANIVIQKLKENKEIDQYV